MMNIYNGNIVTGDDGFAIVQLPEYFEALNKDFRYQLTVIGSFAHAIIASEVKNNQFVIETDQPNVKVRWQITGIRNDPWAQQNPIIVEKDKISGEKGKYLNPKSYNKAQEMGIHYVKDEHEK